MPADCELTQNIDKLRTTKLGVDRIKQNLGLETDDIIEWCNQKLRESVEINKIGKNWYVQADNCVITINAGSYTIITAHKITTKKIKTGGFVQEDMTEAYETFLSMLHKLEKTQEKLKQGTPQWTTAARRLKAMRLAMSLLARELKR